MIVVQASCLQSFAADPVKPLPDHPGNIFLAGEDIVLPLPPGQGNAWQLADHDGTVIKRGNAADGKAHLGQPLVGYYELRRGPDQPRVTLGVVAPLIAPTPASSPICMDVAMAWFYKSPQMAAAASLCKLAGVNWVRDRLAWGEVEPKREEYRNETRYDETARVQSAAGLRVLQVNHSSPGWANPNGKRFPLDLRDAYRFNREIARRWKGQVLAIEPWNEADITMFGGHTGAEMASMQKASYLGLKAGNPDVIASLNVFAINRKATLDDLEANVAWPYFDTCNLHHYSGIEKYPAWYESFRRICHGRPMWVSEFAMPVQWSGDAEAKEPSDADLRIQAERVPMAFAASLHEGSAASFYFLLPHYVEGKTQFGIVHRDLTPRPAYLAMAAVGRLLADARPLGRLKTDKPGLQVYAFRARPDGQEQDVLIGWCSRGTQPFQPAVVSAVYDHLGRHLVDLKGPPVMRRSPL